MNHIPYSAFNNNYNYLVSNRGIFSATSIWPTTLKTRTNLQIVRFLKWSYRESNMGSPYKTPRVDLSATEVKGSTDILVYVPFNYIVCYNPRGDNIIV